MNQITLFKRANAQVSRSAFLPLKMAPFSSTKRISDGGNSSTDLTTPNKSELNLNIPSTTFNPRFHAATSEVQYHPLTTSYLYNWQQNSNSSRTWRIHDLPMQVYERLHLGHFYNKVIKDTINRYKLLKGHKIDFAMGFNCHGMIIENMALQEHMNKEKVIKSYSEEEVREISRNYVTDRLKEYVSEIHRWGIMTDFRTCYTTMNSLYEASVLEVFSELVEKKLIYRDVRPTFWSVAQRKPVHEDEVSHRYESKPGIFVKYKITSTIHHTPIGRITNSHLLDYGGNEQVEKSYPNLHFIVYSTEPWTLTATQGISLHPSMNYTIIECENNEQYVVATQFYIKHKPILKRLAAKSQMRVLGSFFGEMQAQSPLNSKTLRVCYDKEIRPSFGSGINSVCPGHFVDDLKIAQDFGLDREGYVDEKGLLTEEAGEDLKGRNVLRDASAILVDRLKSGKKLLENINESSDTVVFSHLKTKEPLIIRTAEQWFCRIPQYIKEDLLESLEKTRFIGPQSHEEYKSVIEEIENRGEEWCISSRGVWGIPIPVFHVKGKDQDQILLDKHVVNHVKANFEKYGSEIWWKWSVTDLLPPRYKDKAHMLEKGNLIFDNWFESGCAWHATLCKNIHKKQAMVKVNEEGQMVFLPPQLEVLGQEESHKTSEVSTDRDLPETFPADMVVEGLDQNDGLIHSMCLVAGNTREEVPFKELKNHSVIVDKELAKISKLSDNRILIDSIINGAEKANEKRQYGLGADVARLWVAASDNIQSKYEEILLQNRDIDTKNAEINLIRKIYWDLLKYTNNFKFTANTHTEYLSPMDRVILAHLQLFIYNVEKAYNDYDLSKVYRLYMDFMKYYVLDFYIEGVRDRIINEIDSPRQKSSQRIMAIILEHTLIAIAPILVHNAENIYSHISFKQKKDSIFQNVWPAVGVQAVKNSLELVPIGASLIEMRQTINDQYQKIAERAKYKDPRQFEVHFILSQEKGPADILVDFLKDDLEDFLKCSKVKIYRVTDRIPPMDHAALSSFKHKGKFQDTKFEIQLKIYKIDQFKCIRCHKYLSEEENEICRNCHSYLPKNENGSRLTHQESKLM